MSWMLPKLKQRIQIQKGVNAPVGSGSLEREYTTLLRIWAEVKSDKKSIFIQAIRGINTSEEGNSHMIRVRKSAVSCLGRSFTIAFSKGFDSISDINAIKSNYFIFVEESSQDRGRRMAINGAQQDEVHREWVNILASEMEERGSGE